MSLPLNIDFQQIFLHAFNLVLLFGGLYLLLYKPVKKFMDNRTAEYKAADDEAKDKLEKASKAQAEAEKNLTEAQIRIQKDKAQLLLEAEQQAEEIIKQADKTKKKILADAEDAALREKNRMINEAREEIAELAVKAAEKVLLEKTAVEEKTDA